MQTFLPVAPPPEVLENGDRLSPIIEPYGFDKFIFQGSFMVLDRQRLGKQRVETMQLANAILKSSGWSKHPAAKMWARNIPALIAYGIQCCDEWIDRGYKDTVRGKLIAIYDTLENKEIRMPWWMGMESFHRSHRSNLVRKLPEYYSLIWPKERDDLPYVWPF
jgi:hypothetical protein